MREDLPCDGKVGDLVWSTDYTVEAEGPVVIGGSAFSWSGTVRGAGAYQWVDCQEDGRPVSCPPAGSGAYAYAVQVTGRLDCSQGVIGEIVVKNTGLDTAGEWNAAVKLPEGWSLAKAEGEVTLNGTPLLHNCPLAAAGGDKIETSSSGRVAMYCARNEEAARAYGYTLYALEQLSAGELYLMLYSGSSCSPAPLSVNPAAETPAVEFDLRSGSLSLLAPAGSPQTAIRAPQGTAWFAGRGSVVSRVRPSGRTEFATLAGPIDITPANPQLAPFTLSNAQQVSVGESEVGSILDLSQVNLPFVSRPE